MARDGYKILDSDMHVFEPHDLYEKYMDAKWGERIPRGKPRTKHGQIKFTYSDGRPLRPSGTQALAATAPRTNSGESAPGEAQVAHRYAKPLARDYDAVSQLAAMDDEGLDVAVLFRTFPLHCDDSLEPEYANASMPRMERLDGGFLPSRSQAAAAIGADHAARCRSGGGRDPARD